jgi:hypothetical protein
MQERTVLFYGNASVFGLYRFVARSLFCIPRVFDLFPARSNLAAMGTSQTLREVCEWVQLKTNMFEELYYL